MRDEFLISSVGARRWLCAAAILLAELAGAISFDLEALSVARFPIRTVGGTTSRVERLSRSDPAGGSGRGEGTYAAFAGWVARDLKTMH